MQIQTIPINTAAWAIGGLVLYVFCARLWNHYQQTNNSLSRLILIYFLVLGAGFLTLSLPIFLYQDAGTVRVSYLIGDAFRLASMVLMARLFWFYALRQRINFLWVGVPAALLSVAGWVDEWLHFFPYVAGNLVIVEYPLWSSLAQIVLLGAFGTGIGLRFVIQGITEARRFGQVVGAIKSISLGVGFLVVPNAVVANNLINAGGETVATSIVIIAGFVVALVGLELPAVQRVLPAKPSPEATTEPVPGAG